MQTFESCVCVLSTRLARADHLFSNKAVADGAVLSHIDPLVTSRSSRFTYGIGCNRPYISSHADHREREHTRFNVASGTVVLPNAFQSILTKVCTGHWFMNDHASFSFQ